MEPDRKAWNEQQKSLQRAIATHHQQAIELFLRQHAMVHTASMSQAGLWSFEDEVWQGLNEDAVRTIPPKADHSIAWIFWHMTRIEDVTMNLLVAGTPQVISRDHWLERLKVIRQDTGNASDGEAVAALSRSLDIEALRNYRLAVGCRTREIVQQLQPGQLKHKVAPERLQRVLAEGAVIAEAKDLVDYWGRLTIGGLLLMPPTRHNFVHLNEALRLKQKVKRGLLA